MCLVAIAIHAHPRYALVIAANRDEFHDRPALPADEWSERAGVYGGRDLHAGGAWMAADRHGRLALVTNIRRANAGGGRSRGMLVRDLMLDDELDARNLRPLASRIGEYAPLNLIVGECDRLHYMGSDQLTPVALANSVHTLSNATLDTPWPKTARLDAAVRRWCGKDDAAADELFETLGDTATADDQDLPDTGIGRERERFLSPSFIVGETYGTRCSTVYTIDHDGNACMLERSFGPSGKPLGQVELRWRITPKRPT